MLIESTFKLLLDNRFLSTLYVFLIFVASLTSLALSRYTMNETLEIIIMSPSDPSVVADGRESIALVYFLVVDDNVLASNVRSARSSSNVLLLSWYMDVRLVVVCVLFDVLHGQYNVPFIDTDKLG